MKILKLFRFQIIKKNLKTDEKIDIKEIINIKNYSISGYNYLKNYRQFNSEMDKNLLNMKINNSDKFSKLQVTFKKNNENIAKDICILMTEDMINNIRNKHNIQYFMDVTYYETPPPNVNKYKLLIIIAFNLKNIKQRQVIYQFYQMKISQHL
jgi:hypothetical protein